MEKLFINIKELVQVRSEAPQFVAGTQMNELPIITNAFLWIKDGLIKEYGSMEACPALTDVETIDATGKLILPTWCDSHTHIVYAGNREGEFVDKIKGLSYEDIAQKGGGILNSTKVLANTSEDELYEQSKERLLGVMREGTGAIEIKSGYGLTVDSELKMLRVIQRLKKEFNLPIKATFLGAHAIPEAYKNNKEGYLLLLTDVLLPEIKKENLADYIDVFCEKGYFSVEDTERLMQAGAALGIKAKIHVNQFNAIGGVAAGVKNNALSLDHLEVINDEDIAAIKDSKTMPVALPGCSFFLNIPYTPARKMIDADLPIALASDYNPGSAPSGNMNFAVAAACIKMKMTPEEAINAATINGAYAMGVEAEVGSITVGKKANLLLTDKVNSYHSLPYNFGSNLIDKVFISGEEHS